MYNEQAEKEIRKDYPCIISKEDKDFRSENYKTLRNDIGWKDLPHSQTGRLNITKMAIPPKVIYRLNAISI
jgi:hypothetical protein